jgi:hypothetical protein
MAVELRNRLFGQFGGKFDISPTAVFDYPTLGELAAHLVSQLPDAETPQAEAESAEAAQAAAEPEAVAETAADPTPED